MSRFTSVIETGRRLAAGEVTACEAAGELLERAERLKKLNVFIELDADAILAKARKSDERRSRGAALSDFDGVPIGIKDCIAVKGERVSCASKLLEKVVSPYSATAVARLEAAGLIPFGRLNMDEFAMGSSCENSAFGPTANPWDVGRVPGGSSGGSAAAVAAGLVPAALGSDTGGSIRQPAGFCGVVGLKPTYGRVSRYGLVAFASSLDQIGPLAGSVADAAAVFDLISGGDAADSTSLPAPGARTSAAVAAALARGSLKGVRIGLPEEYVKAEGIDPEVSDVFAAGIEDFRRLGAEIVPVSLPHTKYAVAVYYIVATAEASANLARFDGIRYGRREAAEDLISTYFRSRGAGFGKEVQRRILLGTYVLSSGYYDAYYRRAQAVRTLIRSDFDEAFRGCDLMATPVTPTVAFKFGEKSDPLQMKLSDIFTIALNLAGNCGVSIPAGIGRDSGMPVGMQLLAPAMCEDALLGAAAVFETLHPVAHPDL